MQNVTGKKVLLYSGGMDSWLIDKIWKPDIKLYIDMNTRYSKEEIARLPSDVIVEQLNLGKWERDDKIIPLRNLYLIALATNYGDEICLGATAGDRVLDKSYGFKYITEQMFNYLYQKQHWTEERKIKINLDFKQYTKTNLLHIFISQGGNIVDAFNHSFSCYAPIDNHECWSCKPCFRKFVSFALNGYIFSEYIIQKCTDYILREIYPEIVTGRYGRAEEEKEIIQVLRMFHRI